ncbi:hypothetical protein L915_03274 [Phytophthora nicotianae]|uniref:Uncharacterized protein n=1 Tax=Phytophthora nicotianae TaxID=4792 RepID=W2HEL4_PHYNI|nr:hypothetical protein L915_03274 [Phytophthora nicotianae]
MRARGLVLPAPTCWYSIHACMRNVQNSQETLEILFLNPSYEGFLNRYRGTSPNRKKQRFVIELVRNDGFWSSLRTIASLMGSNIRTIVRMFDPIIEALCALEADSGFIAANEQEPEAELTESDEVGSEQESHYQASVGIGMLSLAAEAMSTTSVEENLNQTAAADLPDEDEYQRITVVPLGQLQTFYRVKILKRWKYVHTNAMAVAFLLDPATNLDDYVGEDD